MKKTVVTRFNKLLILYIIYPIISDLSHIYLSAATHIFFTTFYHMLLYNSSWCGSFSVVIKWTASALWTD